MKFEVTAGGMFLGIVEAPTQTEAYRKVTECFLTERLSSYHPVRCDLSVEPTDEHHKPFWVNLHYLPYSAKTYLSNAS